MNGEIPSSRDPRTRSGWLATVILFLILAFALYLRVSHLNSVYWFSGDQGRQSLVVRGIVHDGKWPLVGATHMYGGHNYGPAYYYLNLPAYLLMGGDARFGAATQTVLGCLALVLCFALGRHCGGSVWAGLWAALLLAVNPNAVWMDRTMWSQNELPFFTVFAFWYSGRLLSDRRWPWSILVADLAILTQLHQGGWPIAAGVVTGTVSVLAYRRWRSFRGARTTSRLSAVCSAESASAVSSPLSSPSRPVSSFLRLADWALAGAILVGSLALWIHATRAEPERVVRPMKFLGSTRSLPEVGARIAESAQIVGLFASRQIWNKVRVPNALGVAFWTATAILFVWRLRRATQAARIQALFLGLTLLFFVGAYSCLTVKPEFYTFSAMQPILTVWLALSWLGGPGLRRRAAEEPVRSDEPDRSELPVSARPIAASRAVRLSRVATPVLLSAPILCIAFLGAKWVVGSYLSGRSWVGEHYKVSRRIAARIAEDAAGRPFALALIEGEGNDRAYLRYLLLQEQGVDCANPDRLDAVDNSRPVERLYLVVRQQLPAETAARLRAVIETRPFRIKPVGPASIVCVEFSDTAHIGEFVMLLRGIPGLFVS